MLTLSQVLFFMDDNLGDVTLGNLFSFLDAKESFNSVILEKL